MMHDLQRLRTSISMQCASLDVFLLASFSMVVDSFLCSGTRCKKSDYQTVEILAVSRRQIHPPDSAKHVS